MPALPAAMVMRLTLVKVRKTPRENINQELQWIGNSLGLFNLRDRDSSCFRVFITLVKGAHKPRPLTSDEIAERCHLSRGTVVHHLHRLQDSGIIIQERKGYLLRETNLQALMEDLQRDMEALFSDLRKAAEEIDERLG